jgi:hypothetical protein
MVDKYPVHLVGQPLDPRKRRWEEGAMYTFHLGIHQALFFFKDIRSSERKAVERGRAHFGLYVEGDVIVLLFKIDGPGGKGIDWHEAPYSWYLVPAEARTLPPPPQNIPPGEGALVNILLIDAGTGIIRAMRALVLSHEFTVHLHRAIGEQAGRPFDQQRYQEQVLMLRRKFPTVPLMVAAAQASCSVGNQEGQP